MKFLKRLFIFLLLLGALGYGAYYFGMDFISKKAASTVTKQLDHEADLSAAKEAVEANPELKSFVEEGANVEKDTLPFTTKEEATEVIVKKVGVAELKRLYSEYQNGISEEAIANELHLLEDKLTDEEMLALKALAYKELNP